MHNIFLLCLLSTLIVGYTQVKAFPTEVQCGTVGKRKGRIVHGNVAGDTQLPWMASLKYRGTHNCGGTIISSRFILSVAHCIDLRVDEGNTLDASSSPELEFYTITLGEYNIREEEQHSVNFGIKRIIFHENYKISPFTNDIVLLELDKEIKWTEHIRPICLPTQDIKETDHAIAAGWGRDSYASEMDNRKLRYVKLAIFENDRCNKIYSERDLSLHLVESQMCAGSRGEYSDTNEGDSGGPLLVHRNGREIIVGLTSAGTRESILPKAPGVYTRVYFYLDWIQKFTQGSKTYHAVLHNNRL